MIHERSTGGDVRAGLSYRPDIDGLRAVAIMSVVFFHAGIPLFSGGFVGVDIFFVISGYLITSILWREALAERLSIWHFYERRARRILPALLAVLAATTIAALVTMPPFELKSYGRSLVATLAFYSNFFFLKQSGYFAPAAGTQPLLHTWSLAVEEQFYIIWPAIVAVTARYNFRGRAVWLIPLLLACLSLVVAEWQIYYHPEAAFYLLPARICELVVGAFLALGLLSQPSPKASARLSLLGAALIAIAIICFDNTTRFPGLNSLIPCAGAALIIFSGPSTRVSRALSIRPAVFIGLISYSLYLWHWPLLVFPRLVTGQEPDSVTTWAAIILAIFLSTLTWRFVERPFRRHSTTRSGNIRRHVYLAGVLIFGSILCAQTLVWSGGLGFRADAAVAREEAEIADRNPLNLSKSCALGEAMASDCHVGHGPLGMVSWGDSHVGAYGPALSKLAESGHFSFLQIFHPGCPPVLGVDLARNGHIDARCREANEAAIKMIADLPQTITIVLAARWSLYAETVRSPAESMETAHLVETATQPMTVTTSRLALADGLRNTVDRLMALGHKVFILGQVPEYGSDPGKCVIRAVWNGRLPRCDQSRKLALERLGASYSIIRSIADGRPGVDFFDPLPHICDATTCYAESAQGESLYRDFDHLSRRGSETLAPFIRQAMRGK